MADAVSWYMDEHIPRAVTDGLRRRGIDVLTTQDAGMLHASDDQQLAFAVDRGQAMFTQDDDFLVLAATSTAHAGIVYAPQGTAIGVMAWPRPHY